MNTLRRPGKVQPLGQRAGDLQMPHFHLLQEKLKAHKKKKRKLGFRFLSESEIPQALPYDYFFWSAGGTAPGKRFGSGAVCWSRCSGRGSVLRGSIWSHMAVL
jgi:hypothetical protein